MGAGSLREAENRGREPGEDRRNRKKSAALRNISQRVETGVTKEGAGTGSKMYRKREVQKTSMLVTQWDQEILK